MALSFQVGYISLAATPLMYRGNVTVTFSAGASGAPRCTVMYSGMTG